MTLAQRIEQTPIQEDPWPHVVVENAFQPSLYHAMLKNLPEPDPGWKPLSEMSNKRYILNLLSKNLASEFWVEFVARTADELRAAVEAKFDARGQSTGMSLVYDEPGYSLVPHTDTPNRLITCVFYLARNSWGREQGTMLMRSEQPCATGHSKGVNVEPVKLVPYAPNSGLVFKRTDWTFHSVRPTTTPRWTLSFDVFR